MSKKSVWSSGAFRLESQHQTPPCSVSLRIFSIFLKIANSEIYWSGQKKKKVKGRVRKQAEEEQSEVIIPEDAAG